jgi:hypothetical protein
MPLRYEGKARSSSGNARLRPTVWAGRQMHFNDVAADSISHT